MGNLPWLLGLLGWLSVSGATDPYANQAKLMTENGHLIIMAGSDRNITLRTSGRGYVNLNDQNLLQISQIARSAADQVIQFQQGVGHNIQSRLDSLVRQVSGPRGLVSKMFTLERTILSGNLSTGLSPPSPIIPDPGRPRGNFGVRLNRLTGRVRRVEIQLRRLQNLLSIDECLSNPCRNGGTCQDLFNGFMCTCPTNWQGVLCDEDVNECAEFAGGVQGCQNGATCINKPGTYECMCPDTYFGIHCTLRTNDCSMANTAQLCSHGVCVNQGGNGRGYTCICDQGWTTDLSFACTVDVDECQAKQYPCSHDPYVQCINLPGSFHCGLCPPGYSGNGFQCADIDECAVNNGGCSLVPRVSCINTRGSRVCGHCPPGYTGDGVVCSPVEGGACAINNGGCHQSAQCFQSGGIVTCRCREGYVGSGYGPLGCSPSTLTVNPCHSNPCKFGSTCVQAGSGFTCVCHPHLTGADCSVVVFVTCSPNPCLNGGSCQIETVEGVSHARCSCPSGFQGTRCELQAGVCGGTFDQDQGELQMPVEGAVQRYQNGELCVWFIRVASDKAVQVTFSQLVFDTPEDCDKNYVKVTDPSAIGSGWTFCKNVGDGVIPSVTSATNRFVIKFYSNTGMMKNRFKLSWKAVALECGGEIEAKSHGTIDSPQFPHNYPPNQNCEWRLIGPAGKKIKLLFNTIDLEPSSDCSKDYLKIYEYDNYEPGNLLAQFCNSSEPVPLTTHGTAAYITFHSNSETQASGFRIVYTLVEGCGGVLTDPVGVISTVKDEDEDYLSDQDCEWKIQLPLGDQIKISFSKFDLETRTPCDDFLEVRDGGSSTSPGVGLWCGSNLPPDFTSSSNLLTVIFHSDSVIEGSGFTLNYKTVCGGYFTGSTGEIRSPHYPLPYSSQHNCVYVIHTPPSTAIQLHFKDFDLEKLGTDCDYDYVEVRDGDNANSTKIDSYCGDQKPEDIISNYNYLYITFTSDDSFHFRGFLAEYWTIPIPCGGIMKETTGMFSSPQNEDGYLPNTWCRWVISAPPGWVIRLNWLTFHLEYSNECHVDAVTVYENNTETGNSTEIDNYCGLRLPPSISSNTNVMTVIFHSDDTVHREGFTAHYVMVDRRKVCGGNYYSIHGVMESPNYPENYPKNKECTWVIQVETGRQIMLTFETFGIEESGTDCTYDSVIIRNGLHETSPLVGKYCGSTLPPNVISHTNGLWVHFSSDRSNEFKGFRATWDATTYGCGGTLTSSTGSIFSPNYPQPYGRFAHCYFTISVSQGSRVRLIFVDLDLEMHSRCRLDYVELYDGMDDRSKSLGRFCMTNPSQIISSTNHVYVKFKSDVSYSGRGFHLKYYTECNITNRQRYGVLESHNYPENYPAMLNCIWLLQAPMGSKYNISFSHFELEDSSLHSVLPQNSSEACRYDYLEISEGTKNQTPSKILGHFCGDDKPPTLHSQLNQVYIHFRTDHMIERSGFQLEWVISGCGGIYRERPTGSLTSPNYPNGYPTEMECEYDIIAPLDKSVEITIHDMHMEDFGSCDFDYLIIYGGSDETSPVLSKLCHPQSSPMVVTTSGNHAFMVFHSDHSLSGRGFRATWKFVDSKCGGRYIAPFGKIHSHNYPHNYDHNDDCIWLIQVPSNHLVNLTFVDFDLEESSENTVTDYVHVYDGDSLSAPLLLSHNGNSLPNPASVISTGNSMLIRHKADGSVSAKGFLAQYSIACGARILAKGTGTISMDNVVSASSPWVAVSNNCTWYIIAEDPADKILLTFTFLDTSPNTENYNNSCSYNYVVVHDGDDTNATIISQVCGTKVPAPLRSSGSALTVVAGSLSSFRHLGQFSAVYSTLVTACGGELSSEEGAVASPNYPDGYPPDADCEWQLKASPGNKVTLTFVKFSLQQSDYCNLDSVEVREGFSNGTVLGVYCGSDLPTNLSAHNTIWMRFRSDSSNTAPGFLAHYSLVHGNDLTGDSGQIASPLYPRYYVQAGQYQWTISVVFGKVIRISFSSFYIDYYNPDEECYIFLEIFDGLTVDGSSPSLLKACGAKLPDPVVTTSNVAALSFHNDPFVHGSRFLLYWEAVSPQSVSELNTSSQATSLGCGQLIHISPVSGNHSVQVSSPGYPNAYKPDTHCSWILETDPGFHLVVKFNAVALEQFEDCDLDFVMVYTESTETQDGWKALTPNLCLPNATVSNIETGQRAKLYFESDESNELAGFSATVSAVCGGTFTDSTGTVDMTSLPANTTTGRIICNWEIVVRSGRTIRFSFDQFNLPKLGEESCINNYIMFRNGGYKDSPALGEGKYCGREVPLIPESSSNRVYISYNTMASAPGVVLDYEEVDVACHHEIVLRNKSHNFTISSPNYPEPPLTPHITCTWVVTAPPGQIVHLDFILRFDLNPTPECSKEYIEVRDGGTELSPLIGSRYCFKTPPPRETRGNRMYIKYFTDVDSPNNGFKAVVSIAKCGGTYHDMSSVRLLSPSYPRKYPGNTECLWRIVGFNPDYQLIFNITELNVGATNNCSEAKDYLEFISVDPVTRNITDSIPPTRLCGRYSTLNGTALVPPSISSEVYIRFHSGPPLPSLSESRFAITVTAKRQRCMFKMNAPSGIITSPGYPNPMPRQTFFSCTWSITVPEGRRVSLKILDIDVEPYFGESVFSNAFVFYSNNNFLTSLASNSSLADQTIDSYNNELTLHYMERTISGAHRGFKAEFSSDKPLACGGKLEDQGSFGYSVIGNNVKYYYCEWFHSKQPLSPNQTTFTVTINGTFSTKKNIVCPMWYSPDDTLIIQSSNFFVLGTVCENTTAPVMVRNPFSDTIIRARKRSAYRRDLTILPVSVANFTVTYKMDPCGGTVNGPQAVITSPGYPGQYPPNTDCAWFVHFQPDTKVHVKVESMDLDADCSKDFLILYNGKTQMDPHLTSPLCGNTVPAELKTQGNMMFMEFHSGSTNPSHKGFKITLTQDNSGCGGILHAGSTGELQSPNYTMGDYPNNTECDWTVIQPPGFHASLAFTGRFSVEVSADCTNDYIQVFDWRNEKWEQIGSNFCGRTAPSSMTTSTNRFRVLFRTNPSITSDGFKLSWTAKCGGLINVPENGGTIISPNYPKPYLPRLVCNYTLLAPLQTIYGKFEEFNIEEALSDDKGRCRYDNVTLTTYPTPRLGYPSGAMWMALTHSQQRQEVYCGSNAPAPVYSFNRLEMVFRTDSYLSTKGFLFTYSVAKCGGNITSPTSISEPSNNNFRNCIWYVTAPPEKIVTVKIKRMSNFFYTYRKNYIEFYNGHNISNTSSRIDRVSTIAPGNKNTFRSSSNQMTITYNTDSFFSMLFQAAIGFTYGEKHNCGGTIYLANVSLPYLLQAPDVDGDGHYEPMLSCDWLFLAPDGHQIRTSINKIDIQNCSSCSCDKLEITDGDLESTTNWSTMYCSPSSSSDKGSWRDKTSFKGSMMVQFTSDAAVQLSGFQLSINIFPSPCGQSVRHATKEVQVLQSPGMDGSHIDESVRCLWSIMNPGLIRLHFLYFNLSQPCHTNYLKIIEKPPNSLSQSNFQRNFILSMPEIQHRLCNSQPVDFTINDKNLQLHFEATQISSHFGFKVEYSLRGCSDNYTSPYGQIYASKASRGDDDVCHIRVLAPTPNATISLYFNSFFCPYNGPGSGEGLTVYDGNSEQSQELASFCDTSFQPDPIFSTGPTLYLKFKSMSKTGYFNIIYTTTDQGRGCGGRFHERSGVFASPFYPSPYKKDSACRWDFSVASGNRIVFNFVSINIGSLCTTNHVLFYDIDSTTGLARFHSKHCGNENGAEIQMRGNRAFVKYITTIHNDGQGWLLGWKSRPILGDYLLVT